MQTFLPYRSFCKTAQVLDKQRLGNQRSEAKVILKTLLGMSSGWRNHPAVKMWRGYEGSLCLYLKAIIDEWQRRGCKNEKQRVDLLPNGSVRLEMDGETPVVIGSLILPNWLGNPKFHASHRSNLIRKLPKHYGQFGWKEPDDLPYVWPRQ